MDKEVFELLKKISVSLEEINNRQLNAERDAEHIALMDRSDRRVEFSTQQIQSSFDRIHDKVFNFNNILIGAFLVLGTFPNDAPHISLWTICFPVLIMAFMIWLDFRQMELHRIASQEQQMNNAEMVEYGKKIRSQNLLSLLSLLFSTACLIYLLLAVFSRTLI